MQRSPEKNLIEPIDHAALAANAYRTLGISSSASQSAIESAARMMRIWPDPSRIPPTPWDLPDMGPVARSKSEIEQAVSQLGQPGLRLKHRLLWFGGEHPFPTGAGAPDEPLLNRHTRVINDLQTAWISSTDDDGSRWSPIIERLCGVFQSPQMLAWQEDVERRGQFDKPATTREIAEAIDAVPNAVAAGLVRLAMVALDEGRIEAVSAIASAVGNVPPSPRIPSPVHDLMDRMEDYFNIHCDEMEKRLRDNLRTNSQSPYPFYADNLNHTQVAGAMYEHRILPAITTLLGLSKGLPDRQSRLRGRCGELLVLLALGWEWAGKYVVAEGQLQEALKISRGTLFELQAQKELDRIAPLAQHEREWGWAIKGARPPSVLKTTASRFRPAIKSGAGSSRRGAPVWVAAIVLVIRAMISSLGSNSTGNSSPAGEPPYTAPDWVPPTFSLPDSLNKLGVSGDPFPADPSGKSPSPANPSTIPLGDNHREP